MRRVLLVEEVRQFLPQLEDVLLERVGFERDRVPLVFEAVDGLWDGVLLERLLHVAASVCESPGPTSDADQVGVLELLSRDRTASVDVDVFFDG